MFLYLNVLISMTFQREKKTCFIAIESDSDRDVYKGLKMCSNVRWLSRGFVLKRFVEYFYEIKYLK